jgi:hypothetical protein
MSSSQLQQLRTRMFARVLGPFFAIVGVTVVARTSDMRTLVSDFDANAAWPFVTGAFLLMAALVIIALHPYWRGAAAITVSLMGWILTLRAVILMAFPHAFMAAAKAAIGMTGLWVTVSVLIAAVGLYLTYVGWGPAPSPAVGPAETSTPDLPRAA